MYEEIKIKEEDNIQTYRLLLSKREILCRYCTFIRLFSLKIDRFGDG